MPPDVIVLDLAMPHLDGWTTARVLRSYPTTSRIPIIACTGVSGSEAATRTRIDGIMAVVRKPCLARDVEQVVSELLGSEAPCQTDEESGAG